MILKRCSCFIDINRWIDACLQLYQEMRLASTDNEYDKKATHFLQQY